MNCTLDRTNRNAGTPVWPFPAAPEALLCVVLALSMVVLLPGQVLAAAAPARSAAANVVVEAVQMPA
ncbi:MAG: hypothetical protein FJY55_07435 [Betaproteobacteria bacterium]|nr:hypothetical protein [Betaproteobacteria bacterium]